MDTGQATTVLTLRSFEPAFAVGPHRPDVQRRFCTLLVEGPSPRLSGGTSYVCRATTTDGMPLAVKRLLAPGGGDPELAEARRRTGELALFREYQSLLAASGTPGLPRLYGYGTCDDGPLILMEWIEGVTLRDAARDLPRRGDGVDGRVVCAVGVAVLRTLVGAGAGGRAVVHRDVSSRNVMIRTSARPLAEQAASLDFDVVLVDFGSATPTEPQVGSLTQASGLVRYGTPAYAPPEMLTSDVAYPEEVRQSPLVDVYALCSVLYELYCGRPPFETEGSYYLAKTTGTPAPLVPHEEADRALCVAIMGGIRAEQDARTPARELLASLEAWAAARQGRAPAAAAAANQPAAAAAAGLGDPSGTAAASAPEGRAGRGGANVARRAFLSCLLGAAACGAAYAAYAAARDGGLPQGLLAGLGQAAGAGGAAAGAGTEKDAGPGDAAQGSDGAADGTRAAVAAVAYAWPALDADSRLWGLLAPDGSWALEPSLATRPGSWSAAGTPASDGSLWGLVADDGSWLVSPSFAALGPLTEDGYAAARDTGGLWGIVRADGSWAVEPACQEMALSVRNGMVQARRSSSAASWGLLATDGGWALAPGGFDALGSCGDNGLAAARVSGALWGYVRTSDGTWAIEPTLAEARPFSAGLAACRPNQGDAALALIDASGARVREGLADARPFSSGVAAARDAGGDAWGLLGQDGGWVVAPAFARLGDVHEGVAPAQDAASGLWGLVDASGSWAVPPAYAEIALGDLAEDQPTAS